MPNIQPLISIVVPAYNEGECLEKLHQELRRVIDSLPYRFELLFVDDGSSDSSMAILAGLRARDPRVCFLSLSRNFGHQAALSAGLDHARGDAVIMMDGDLQHPPEVIPQLIERWRAGFEVVNTIRQHTESISPAKQLFSNSFYWLFNKVANVRIEAGAADFRLMARPALEALNSLPEKQRFLRGLVPWLGFKQTTLNFSAPERWAGGSKYTFWRSLRFAIDGMTAFNFFPLRRVTALGGLIALAGVGAVLCALGLQLFASRAIAGWMWVLLCGVFFGGCQILLLGVLGEYVGHVLEQVKGRPVYIIQKAVGLASKNAIEPDLPFGADQLGSRDAA